MRPAHRMGSNPDTQHMGALDIANAHRQARGQRKREIRAGTLTLEAILAPGPIPPELRTLSAYDLLMTQHRWAHKRTVRALEEAEVGEARPLGQLTARERAALTAAARARGAR